MLAGTKLAAGGRVCGGGVRWHLEQHELAGGGGLRGGPAHPHRQPVGDLRGGEASLFNEKGLIAVHFMVCASFRGPFMHFQSTSGFA